MSDASAFTSFERSVHDRLAATYGHALEPVTRHAVPPLLTATGVRSGTSLLDVACGSGVLTAAATELGAATTALDLSPNMARLTAGRVPAARAVVGSAEALPFAVGAFDAVAAAFAIGHVPDPAAAIAEMRRVLRQGGTLALAWWQSADAMRLNGDVFAALTDAGVDPSAHLPAGPPTFRWSRADGLAALMTDGGFADVAVTAHEGRHELADLDAWWALALGSFARISTVLRALDATQTGRVRAALAERAQAHATPSGTLAVPFAFLVAAGRRPKSDP